MKAGNIEKLFVSRFTDNGAYLMNTDEEEVLLPNRYVEEGMEVGDELKVFVYCDSEDRLVASTEMPFIIAGEVALLECIDVSAFGAFLDWGLPKDLFVPLSNQSVRMEEGKWYLVYAYVDDLTNRVVGTAKLNRFINNDEITVEPKEEVELVIGMRNEMGYRVVINNKHWGMIYDNQIFKEIEIGDIVNGYIVRVTDDYRIDVSLTKLGMGQVEESSEIILELLEKGGGELALGDKSSPDDIYNQAGISKKMFKRGAGKLLKDKVIEISDYKITKIK